MSLSWLHQGRENGFLTRWSEAQACPYLFTWGWDDPNCAGERSLSLPHSPLVRVSEVIPTASVERPLSEVGVPEAKESPH
jgi:hypothetical protein